MGQTGAGKTRTTTARGADAIDRIVGRRIAARRAALGKSQTVLAAELGVSFQQLQKYESGQNRVSASRLHRIAVALEAPVGAFFPDGPDEEAEPAELTAESRAVLADFDRIPAAPVRRAVARIVAALAA